MLMNTEVDKTLSHFKCTWRDESKMVLSAIGFIKK